NLRPTENFQRLPKRAGYAIARSAQTLSVHRGRGSHSSKERNDAKAVGSLRNGGARALGDTGKCDVNHRCVPETEPRPLGGDGGRPNLPDERRKPGDCEWRVQRPGYVRRRWLDYYYAP